MPEEQYILFRRKRVPVNESKIPREHPFFRMIREMESEAWKTAEEGGVPTREVLKFVAAVKTPAEVAGHVRKKPLWKYVLFRGVSLEINVGMPVFADGMNLDQLSAEWGPAPEGLEFQPEQ